MRASVCSTESCRCAAIWLRCSSRMRRIRSPDSSRHLGTSVDDSTAASPARGSSTSATPDRATGHDSSTVNSSASSTTAMRRTLRVCRGPRAVSVRSMSVAHRPAPVANATVPPTITAASSGGMVPLSQSEPPRQPRTTSMPMPAGARSSQATGIRLDGALSPSVHGVNIQHQAYRRMPAPPHSVSTTNSARTIHTRAPRWRASPALTPVTRQSRSRVSGGRGGGATRGGRADACAEEDMSQSNHPSRLSGSSRPQNQGPLRGSPHGRRPSGIARIEA